VSSQERSSFLQTMAIEWILPASHHNPELSFDRNVTEIPMIRVLDTFPCHRAASTAGRATPRATVGGAGALVLVELR